MLSSPIAIPMLPPQRDRKATVNTQLVMHLWSKLVLKLIPKQAYGPRKGIIKSMKLNLQAFLGLLKMWASAMVYVTLQ